MGGSGAGRQCRERWKSGTWKSNKLNQQKKKDNGLLPNSSREADIRGKEGDGWLLAAQV